MARRRWFSEPSGSGGFTANSWKAIRERPPASNAPEEAHLLTGLWLAPACQRMKPARDS
jgi:hypothetical protein